MVGQSSVSNSHWTYTLHTFKREADLTDTMRYDEFEQQQPRQSATVTSDAGQNIVVPAEVQGLCWGGFLLHFFWCVGNGVWLPAILILVPYVNIVVWLMLLFKGNEWAWRSKEWESIEHFKQVQHNWVIAGLIFYGIVFAIAILIGIMPIFSK